MNTGVSLVKFFQLNPLWECDMFHVLTGIRLPAFSMYVICALLVVEPPYLTCSGVEEETCELV